MSETIRTVSTAGDAGRAIGRTEAQHQEALLKKGALQNAILTSASFSIIATDEKGIIQLFNAGAERMLGYRAAEVVNRISPDDIHDPQEVAARARALSLELDTTIAPGFEALAFKASRGIEDIYELTYIRKDGSRFPACVSITALRDNGGIIGYLLIGTDITQRRESEIALRKSEERYRALFESTDEGFFVIEQVEGEAGGPSDFRYVEANPAFTAHSGLSGVVGKTIRQVLPGEFEEWCRIYDAVLSAGAPVKLERELVSQGRALELFAFRVEDLTHRRVAVIFKDVTESKRSEAILNGAIDVAQKASRAKTEFLSSMSHELRTPLNAILGFAQLMESGSPPQAPVQKRNLDQILKAGWYLLELINEILDLAMVESGKVTLSTEPVSLAEVMLECRAMVERQAHERGIAMTFPRFAIPCLVKADRTRVKQVLINLLSNAIKYNRPGGTVAVECAPTPSASVRISVRDTGAGLAPAQLAQLFQPFNRIGKETGAEEGTGIGLVVTKHLVELMGGSIGVDSVVGEGSVFWVELGPSAATRLAARKTGYAERVSEPKPESTLPHTLLYVEDNPANLELVEQIVARRADLRLISAANGNLGIESARVYQPQAILMDINLPGISGTETMKILRADPATAHIPIIALSANAVPRDIDNALEAGFFSYLTKPIQIHTFLEALDRALDFSRANTSALTAALAVEIPASMKVPAR